jgi:hypothetical protein
MKNLDGFADVVVDALARTVDGPKIAGRFAVLEQRLAALEQKPSVKFCGVWDRDRAYQSGDAVVHSGGLWVCRAATTGPPNQDFVGWTLAVKSRSIR